jgi:nitrite reductase/ring-hydroxylating ferredoxin subunit
MDLKSKILIFLITILTVVLLISCKKNKNDVLPDVFVDFTINLSDPEFFALNAITNSKIITSATNNWGISAAGYDGNGIIVYKATDSEFYAYDCTCPHDYAVNGLSIKIYIDFISAICPRCSTTYALSAGGIAISGPGKYPLKNYKTNYSGQFVRVWNSF